MLFDSLNIGIIDIASLLLKHQKHEDMKHQIRRERTYPIYYT
jgi:hypothetical protein